MPCGQAVRVAILVRLWAKTPCPGPGAGSFSGVDHGAAPAVASFPACCAHDDEEHMAT